MDVITRADILSYAGNFESDGKIFLVRCPRCKQENHAFRVAGGTCAWCEFDANDFSLGVKK